jgi:hypothetical protein
MEGIDMRAMTSREKWAQTAAGAARPGWSTALYWICWLFLAGLAIRLALR